MQLRRPANFASVRSILVDLGKASRTNELENGEHTSKTLNSPEIFGQDRARMIGANVETVKGSIRRSKQLRGCSDHNGKCQYEADRPSSAQSGRPRGYSQITDQQGEGRIR